jgi:ABC-type multidrug transport system fused ATPase/permease subunit
MGIVKSLRGEERVQNRLLSRVEELTSLGRVERNAALSLNTTLDISAAVIKAAFILFGGLAIFRAELGWGDLFQILAYVEIFSRHVNNITKFVSKYPKCMASVDRLEELHRELELYPETSGARAVDHGGIALAARPLEFRGVSFRHDGGPALLDGFCHAFSKGKVVAVVGQSGIGKSSFSRLLNRLSDPTEGSILLGGEDLRAYPVRELRRAVRVISQESFLLAGSVRENLQLAAAHVLSDAEIERALAAVNAWEFVRALPAGLDTPIGEAGLQLSGGQAKRIHLARAFLDRESSVLLFDEPTTGLDTHSAEAVVRSIRALRSEKSVVFWITHRMQEVGSADEVLFFAPGARAVIGTAPELLGSNPEFRALTAAPGKSRGPAATDTPSSDEENRMGLSTIAGAFAKNWPGL